MPLEVQRKEKEHNQNLIRRFSKKIRRSGILIQARKNRFRKKPKSKELNKRSALRKEKAKKKYEKLRKLGKM